MDDYDILNAIDLYGGSFEKAIGNAYRRADNNNRLRVRAAFPEIFEKYAHPRWHQAKYPVDQ